ncbi:sensor histidine kinase [Ponticoccus alexandrii]|uniref:histidine kinase n=1 Tax=Ponticoccus alexandrii TaxID=1943633 RepID=A0ABX7FE17_9RHOB|nr:HAMP domain-containing sensor histidine kinase [Ponticoccus alexandrii]ETA50556.1 histidine kinase [Rhodobacteraceae bacterium PD-2]QRF68638.1 sensor histidine kinase [Ponticoccus alexandrii]
MDRGDILSGDAFAAVLRSALAFVVVLVLFGWVTLTYLERSLLDELGQDVQQRWNIIAAEHESESQDHVAEAIETMSQRTTGPHHAAALFNGAGEFVAGNILSRPEGQGLQIGPLDHAAAAPQAMALDYIYFTGPLSNRTLTVGLRLDLLYRTQVLVFRALTISGFIVILTMLTVGYFLSARSLQRLRDIESALSRTSDGDTEVRIAENGGNTQIDRIARQMNTHFDRLSRMMATTRNTAAATAHDLKSPLGRAYLSLEKATSLVERGDDPADALADTQAELDTMRVIFDTYLQLSRIEASGTERLTLRVDLKALVIDMVETFAPIAEDSGQAFSFDFKELDNFSVMGDGQMLQQMVANLFDNAVTHGSEGNVITVSLGHEKGRIRIIVADTGPGIPDDSKEKVFEPFQRLDPSRSKPGTGLGLALVRAIAEKHGGQVTLRDNHPGLIVDLSLPAVVNPDKLAP